MSLEPMLQAVCCLILNTQGQVLAVSRRNDPTQWGLPGGKVEPYESLVDAVIREVFEETGCVILKPESVYTAVVPGEKTFLCTTYIAKVRSNLSELHSMPNEGTLSWQPPSVLVAGPFGAYNRALFEALNIEWRVAANDT